MSIRLPVNTYVIPGSAAVLVIDPRSYHWNSGASGAVDIIFGREAVTHTAPASDGGLLISYAWRANDRDEEVGCLCTTNGLSLLLRH